MKVKTLPRRLALPAVVFFFLCILSLSPKNSSYALATVANPHGVAVIIGNRSYGGAGEVKYAHRDADAFRRYVLDVLGFDPENIIDLRDASQAKIVGTFGTADEHRGDLWAWLDPEGGSDVVVYYSGHGMPGLNEGDRHAYILPVDANPNRPELNAYSIELLTGNLRKLSARSISVFLDACFSGYGGNGQPLLDASPVLRKPMLPDELATNMTILTAATGNQIAYWDENAGHGMFTHHLLDALYGKGDVNKDGKVTAAETNGYLNRHMLRAVRRTYRRDQTADLRDGTGTGAAVLSVSRSGGFPERPLLDPIQQVIEIAITTTPYDAAVYFPEIETEYREGLKLNAGTYRIKITRNGYRPLGDSIKVEPANWKFDYSLERDCRIVQVPRNECRTVTRYREKTRERSNRRRVKTTFKIGPHYGYWDTACREGTRKIENRLDDECDYDEELVDIRTECTTCDHVYCYLKASGKCEGTETYTEEIPYTDQDCKEILKNQQQCAPL